MTKQLSIDGTSVDASKARVSGTFDVAEGDEKNLEFDLDVVFVGVARVTTPTFRETKGVVTRIDVLKPSEVRFIWDADERSDILEKYDFDIRVESSHLDHALPVETTTIVPEVELVIEDDGELSADEDEEMRAFLEWRRRRDEIEDEFVDAEEPQPASPVSNGTGDKLSTVSAEVAKDPMLQKFLGE